MPRRHHPAKGAAVNASIPVSAEQRTWMLFQSVYWPAAAGNVLWALINTILYALSTGAWLAVLPSLAILVVLGTYLSVEWVRNLTGEATMKWWLSFAAIDGAHLVLICAAAIMVTPNVLPEDHIRLLPWVLATFYLLTAFGHARNVWNFEGARSRGNEHEKRRYRRLAIGNPAFGLVLSLALCLVIELTRAQCLGPAALALAEQRITWACCAILVITFAVSQYRHVHWQPDVTEQRIAARNAAEARAREAKAQAERDAEAAAQAKR
jgi:hypothetical protein